MKKEAGMKSVKHGIRRSRVIAALLASAVFFSGIAGAHSDVFAEPGKKSQEVVVDLNSGAARGGGFISIDETFVTADGKTLELIATGLKPENADLFLQSVKDNYGVIEAGDTLKIVDDAFCDAEKWDTTMEVDDYENDSDQCWAATASNMLWISGWTDYLDPTAPVFGSEDELFKRYNISFSDNGADVDRGIDWAFMGEFIMLRAASAAGMLDRDTNSAMKSSFVSTLVQNHYDMAEGAEQLECLERLGPVGKGKGQGQSVFHLSIGSFYEGSFIFGGHAVTACGIIKDPAATDVRDMYKAIIIIDSDNDSVASEKEREDAEAGTASRADQKAARPNSYTVFPLGILIDTDGTVGWEVVGYGDETEDPDYPTTTGIAAINELPYPSAELINENTETEGSCNILKHPDFTLDFMFMTTSEVGFIDPFFVPADEVNIKEFKSGDPIRMNYFVTNRSLKDVESYPDDKRLSLSWSVTKASDNIETASGKHISELPITSGVVGGSYKADILAVNEKDGVIEAWPSGTYKLHAELNSDRAVMESYFKNNLPKELTFVVTPAKALIEKGEQETNSISIKVSDTSDTGITGYKLRYRVKGTDEWTEKIYSADQSELTIYGLEPDTEYEVSLCKYIDIPAAYQTDGIEASYSGEYSDILIFGTAKEDEPEDEPEDDTPVEPDDKKSDDNTPGGTTPDDSNPSAGPAPEDNKSSADPASSGKSAPAAKTPATKDMFDVGLWMMIMVVSFAGGVLVLRIKNKES